MKKFSCNFTKISINLKKYEKILWKFENVFENWEKARKMCMISGRLLGVRIPPIGRIKIFPRPVCKFFKIPFEYPKIS